MEKFLFGRVPVWVVCLLAIVGGVLTWLFGIFIVDFYEEDGRFGALSKKSARLSQIPREAISVLTDRDAMAVGEDHEGRFEGRAGWSGPDGTPSVVQGYLLLSRYDGDARRHVIELVDLADYSVKHTWRPDANQLLDEAINARDLPVLSHWNQGHFRYIHPLLLPNGDLVVKDHTSPLFGLDACARPLWSHEVATFHHSTEMDADGNFWVPARKLKSDLPVGGRFRDDTITQVSPSGEVLFEQSLTQAFIDAGLSYHILTAEDFNIDPIHLNDIQPVLEDGPHWKKGDVFLSMRAKSIVALFRPEIREFVWMRKGPWMGQHDVDILDDHTISVFSNRARTFGGGPHVEGVNEVLIYDFRTDEVTSPYLAQMEDLDVRTVFEGLSEHLPGGELLIEEENAGRILILSEEDVVAEYVNRGRDGVIYRLGWSRYLEKDLVAPIMATLQSAECDAP